MMPRKDRRVAADDEVFAPPPFIDAFACRQFFHRATMFSFVAISSFTDDYLIIYH